MHFHFLGAADFLPTPWHEVGWIMQPVCFSLQLGAQSGRHCVATYVFCAIETQGYLEKGGENPCQYRTNAQDPTVD